MTTLDPRVLIVDDDPGLREVLLLLFDDAGFEAQAAEHGRAALDILATWRPQVIVLDLMMPVMDGWAFRARQLAQEHWSDIPVVVLSAGHNLQERVAGLGAAATIPKPFDLDCLISTVSRLVA